MFEDPDTASRRVLVCILEMNHLEEQDGNVWVWSGEFSLARDLGLRPVASGERITGETPYLQQL